MALSFRIVEKYGKEKNSVTAEAVGQIVEYIDGIRTFRSYGMGGVKNRNTTDVLRKFSAVSYQYEAHGIPVNFAFNIVNRLTVPLIMWIGFIPWQSGKIPAITFLFLCMMPMVFARLIAAISVDLFSYRNLLLSKANIQNSVGGKGRSEKPSCFFSQRARHLLSRCILSYVQGKCSKRNALLHPGLQANRNRGRLRLGQINNLNLIAKYYEPESGEIAIGGQSIRKYQCGRCAG